MVKMYTRKLVQSKSKFMKGSFRTVDVGRPGHTKIVVGRLKAGPHKGKTRTHEILYKK